MNPGLDRRSSDNHNWREEIGRKHGRWNGKKTGGPKERGRERKMYKLNDGSRGVYRCILKAIATNPPKLEFPYDELVSRVSSICHGEAPSGSSVQGSCEQMIKLAKSRFPTERQIDWNKEREVLDIAESYLLFCLRWSERLEEPNE